MQMSRELDIAIKAAKAAGSIIMTHYSKRHKIKKKSDRLGIVTEADFAAQRKIKSVILREFPAAAILGFSEDRSFGFLFLFLFLQVGRVR